jgi:hypothetical protein
MSDWFIWVPIIIILSIGVCSLVMLLVGVNDKIDTMLDEELSKPTSLPFNVVEFRMRDGDGGDCA